MKSIIDVTTSGSVDITNKRVIHLASSLSTSAPVSRVKRGAGDQGHWVVAGDMEARTVSNSYPPSTAFIESGESGSVPGVPGFGGWPFGLKVRRRRCKYGIARPIMKRIRRENGVWKGQSKENMDAVMMSR